MKFLRHLAWPIALLPALAAFVWTSFASRLPESEVARRALGEMSMRWHFGEILSMQAEPAHLLARAVHIAALQVPGSTFWWAAAANAVLALLVVFALAAVARRAFGLAGGAQPFVLALAGLLVCSPAFGVDWLRGERVGLFLVPLLLLWASWLLLGTGRFTGRALLALALASLAPFCHTNGLLVFVALAPPLLAAARRAGSGRRMGWIVALLLCGNLAAIASMMSAGSLALGDTGLLGRLLAAPTDALLHLLRTTGSAWLDPLPAANWDEPGLGAFAWALPLLLWWAGDRSEAARQKAAPWWSCVWFGLSLFVIAAERHGTSLSAGTLRELTFGAFLLPVGCLGVLAARFGAGLVPVAAGALLLLSAQDWHRGIEDLRLARAAVEHEEMVARLPVANGGKPLFGPELLQALYERGWMPRLEEPFVAVLHSIPVAPAMPTAGGVLGGDDKSVHGLVRSSLSRDNVACVVVTLAGSAEAGGGEQMLGLTLPDAAGHGRDVPWAVTFDQALAEGAELRVTGYRLRSGTFVSLGRLRVVHGAAEVETGG